MPRGEGAYYNAHLVHLKIADVNWTDISQPGARRHYLWRHYVAYETMWPIGGPLFLARDDVARFSEWLFHNLAAVVHRDWRVGVESLDGAPSCAPGDGERWQLIRRMFVNETGGYDGSDQSLFLLQAIPRSWLRPGSRLAIKDMGTWLGGKVDLEARVADDGTSIQVDVRLAGLKVAPKEVWMHLRSFDGRPLAAATTGGGEAVSLAGDDRIALPRATDQVLRIVGHF